MAATGIAGVLGLTMPAMAVGAAEGDALTPTQQSALDLGLQVAPKGGGGAASLSPAVNPNPYLANLPDISSADYWSWNKKMDAAAAKRADSAKLAANRQAALAAPSVPPFVYDEQEPAGVVGTNDSHPDAEPIDGFGTAATRNQRVRILGELAATAAPATRAITTTEDQGSIPLATDAAIPATGGRVTTTSVLGDGPHGSAGTGSNDFDFYEVELGAGRTLTASTIGSPSTTDTILVVFDAAGEPVAANDDASFGVLASQLSYKPPAPGTFYVMVGGYSSDPLPADPNDSGSGSGGADEGNYNLAVASQQLDADFYSVRLRPGDTIGATSGGGATGLTVRTPAGEQRVGGIETDASSLYPPTSPLPGGGNTTIAYVAEEAGWYSVEVSGLVGDYEVTVEGYRPGTQGDRGRTQTVLLDFAPGRVNTGTWGGPGVRSVSPFASFVPLWGIPRASARQVENKVLAGVKANLDAELEAGGLNPNVNVEVLNARTNPELIGQENVSHIYVAGTIAESGISTIGIAQYIDPGNYGHQDEAIVLLDVLSAPAGPASSLNTFMTAASDRVKFVSAAVSNVVAHEVGHTIGNYHTDNADEVGNMMDSGGANFATNLYGVGPDGIGGTADDANVAFVTDTYAPVEGFTGLENTLNVSAWAYSGR
ncbi:hypothetical protein C7S10_06730 [Nocardioides currus]|uniref:Peptidase C-terminal archaeal/bacterial domain-containing protein n=2 Tax=Nocardioides currus TaxID=2133958 RepID=A0A2R7Z0F5_9ACTN|nr:hypothetical protein C7S10_06730 [Nocardioides currus]